MDHSLDGVPDRSHTRNTDQTSFKTARKVLDLFVPKRMRLISRTRRIPDGKSRRKCGKEVHARFKSIGQQSGGTRHAVCCGFHANREYRCRQR